MLDGREGGKMAESLPSRISQPVNTRVNRQFGRGHQHVVEEIHTGCNANREEGMASLLS